MLAWMVDDGCVKLWEEVGKEEEQEDALDRVQAGWWRNEEREDWNLGQFAHHASKPKKRRRGRDQEKDDCWLVHSAAGFHANQRSQGWRGRIEAKGLTRKT